MMTSLDEYCKSICADTRIEKDHSSSGTYTIQTYLGHCNLFSLVALMEQYSNIVAIEIDGREALLNQLIEFRCTSNFTHFDA